MAILILDTETTGLAGQYVKSQPNPSDETQCWHTTLSAMLQLTKSSLILLDAEREVLQRSKESASKEIDEDRDVSDGEFYEPFDGVSQYDAGLDYDAVVTEPYLDRLAESDAMYKKLLDRLHTEQSRFLELQKHLLELKNSPLEVV